MSESVTTAIFDATLVITIQRPESRNAIDFPTAQAVTKALDQLQQEPTLRVGVITGAGGHFSAGMDLKAFLRDGQRPEVPGRGLAGLTQSPPEKPLIAAVEGFALAGGFEMALACDLVVASTTAQFGLPEVKRGLLAGSGGLIRLARRVPSAVALEVALTGRMIEAEEAKQLGLINSLTSPGGALDAAMDLARQISSNSPSSVRATKRLMRRAQDMKFAEAWAEQDDLLSQVLEHPDAKEGAAAFAERREPVWGS